MQFSFWITILFIIPRCKSDISNSSSNVCYNQEVTITPVNTSYQVPVAETKWEFCWSSWSFKCSRDVYHFEERIKTENITRISNIAACCPGYEENDNKCVPTCDPPCSHGTCSAPFTCSCDRGYSGAHCQEEGCPGGRWGEGCKKECSCKNGGKCHAVDGTCYCPAGYNGTMCQDKCSNGTFGDNCGGTCNCSVGTSCHHISGECVKCSNDTFGDKCEQACDCNKNGTALCSHVDGRCFCEANWFGTKCHLECPFGFLDGNCVQHLANQTCSCPSDLFLCDPHLGCVCPLGQDCGIEQNHQDQIRVGFMQKAQSSTGLIVAVVVFLLIGIVISSVVVIYYRKRLRVMKKDLANRSGQGNSGLDNDEFFTPEPLTPISELHIPEFPVVENNRNSFSRPSNDMANNPMYNVNYSRPEKNVNLARENLNKASNQDNDDLYQEPVDLKNNLNNILSKNNAFNNDTDEDDTYDHIGPHKPKK